MDYGKYKYEAAQRAKESRKKASNVVVKEMKYRPKIGIGDFDTKTRKVEKFLQEGHKVKITIMFRGRRSPTPNSVGGFSTTSRNGLRSTPRLRFTLASTVAT